MADKSFGVKDINLIGASGTPTIESPNNLNINAVNVAISTDITVGGKVSLGTGTSISSPAANTLTLGTNSVERLRITSGGDTEIRNTVAGVTNAYSQSLKFRTTQTNGQSAVTGEIAAQGKSGWGGDLVFFSKDANSTPNDTVTERMRITSAGMVGINTTTGFDTSVGLAVRNGVSGSDHTMIDIIANTNETSRVVFSDDSDHNQGRIQYNHIGNSLGFYTNGNNERLHIDSSGRIGINADSFNDAAEALRVQAPSGQSNTHLTIMAGSTSGYCVLNFGDDDFNEGRIKYSHSNNDMGFFVNDTERMRLSGNGEHMVYSQGTVSALRTAASSSGSAEILYCTRNSSSVTVGTGVYAIYSNGSASSLSDRTQKKNIETTRDGYLEDLNRLRVVKYNWNDQEDGTPKELGLIAQEVEEVFPGLISNMRSDVGIGTTASTKGVKTSVLPYMLLKALQEANAEIVALKARVNTLEGS